MADRGMPWRAGLAALGAVCVGLATALEFGSAALFHEADEFSRNFTGSEELTPAESDHYSSLWTVSAALHDVASPLLAGGVLAALGFVTVLAIRWQRRERSLA